MIYNFTPHTISIYEHTQFVNLEKVNATTWVADRVEGEPLFSTPSVGSLRIASTVEIVNIVNLGFKFDTVKTRYGELTGLDICLSSEDILIVSLPTQSMALASGHPLASQMASPYKVVRQKECTSTVLGCMGLSFQ